MTLYVVHHDGFSIDSRFILGSGLYRCGSSRCGPKKSDVSAGETSMSVREKWMSVRVRLLTVRVKLMLVQVNLKHDVSAVP